MPYRPGTRSLAVLIDPSGTQGWAVGGDLEANERAGDGRRRALPRRRRQHPPAGILRRVPLGSGDGDVRVRGRRAVRGAVRRPGARGHRPRRVAVLGAARLPGRIGVRAFLYTGPSVTTGESRWPQEPSRHPVRARARNATLAPRLGPPLAGLRRRLAAGPGRAPAGSGRAREATFEQAFAGFPEPFGRRWAEAERRIVRGETSAARPPTTPSTRKDGRRRAGDRARRQRRRRRAAHSFVAGSASCGKPPNTALPAIVVGDADLGAQIAAGRRAGGEGRRRSLVNGGACLRRLGLLLRLAGRKRQKPLRGRAANRFPASAPGRSATWKSSRSARRLPRRQRLPARPGRRRRAQPAGHQPRAGHRAADSRTSASWRSKPKTGSCCAAASPPCSMRSRAARARATASRWARTNSPKSTPTSRFPSNCVGPPARARSSPSTRSAHRGRTSATSSSRTSPRPNTTRSSRAPTANRSTIRTPACSAPTTPARRS